MHHLYKWPREWGKRSNKNRIVLRVQHIHQKWVIKLTQSEGRRKLKTHTHTLTIGMRVIDAGGGGVGKKET